MRLAAALFVVLLSLAAMLGLAGAAQAETINVTKQTDDAVNGCSVVDCSLREAVIQANGNGEDDVIVLAPGTHDFNIPNPGGTPEDAAAAGDLDFTADETTLRGSGAGSGGTVIDAGDLDRAIDVLPAANTVTVTDLKILDGNVSGARGGAIRTVDTRVTVARTVFESNTASHGGAVSNSTTTTTSVGQSKFRIEDSVFTANSVSNEGGAIHNDEQGRLSIANSTVAGNFTGSGRGGGITNRDDGGLIIVETVISGNTAAGDAGGGIQNENETTLAITDSVVSDNEAAGRGGGLFIQNNSQATIAGTTVSGNRALGTDSDHGGGGLAINNDSWITVSDSTFSSNTAARNGGGIHNRGFSAFLRLVNTTLSGNRADADGGGYAEEESGDKDTTFSSVTIAGNSAGGAGGGIRAASTGAGGITVEGTLLSGNTATAGANNCALDPGRALISRGFNLDTGVTCGLTGTGDIPNGNSGLGPLGDNGGPTQTHALLAGSQALDAGNPACPAPARDQRDVPRPQGVRCDIGAFERIPPGAPPAPPAPVTVEVPGPSPDAGAFGRRLSVAFRRLPSQLPKSGIVTFRIANGNPFAIRGTLTVGSKRLRASVSRRRPLSLGRKRFRVRARSTVTVRLKVSRRNRARVRRLKRVSLFASVVLRDPNGNERKTSRRFTLRAAK